MAVIKHFDIINHIGLCFMTVRIQNSIYSFSRFSYTCQKILVLIFYARPQKLSAFLCLPYPMTSSPQRNNRFNLGVFLIPHLTKSWRRPCGLLKGQVLIQLPQSFPLVAQKDRHFSASICHVNTPSLFEILCISSDGSPYTMAWLGQCFAHFSQILQKSRTPNSIGWSGISGKSVNTLASRTLGPNSGVIRIPFLAISPSPASIAKGTLHAVSLPQAIA